MFTNEICPYRSYADHRDKSREALHAAHVGVLDVESRRLHCFEGGFDLPLFFVSLNGVLRTIEAYQNLQFRNSVRIFDSAAGKIDILTSGGFG